MRASYGWLGGATFGVLLSAIALVGCGDDVSCGAGTHQVGGVCVADDPTPPPGGRDSGTPTPPTPTPPTPVPPPTPGVDGGPTPPPPPPGEDGGAPPPPPPGDGGFMPPPPPGDGGMPPMSMTCSTPEMCAAWAMELVALLDAHRAAMGICGGVAYTWNDGLAMTSLRNSQAMAASDSLTGIDMLFDVAQADSMMTAYDGGAAFSGTRSGPMDVLTRWLTSGEIAMYFSKCNLTHVGAAFATGTSPVSYGTIILFDPTP